MSSFTRDADRNCVVACCCTVNAPACRSNTARPTVIPAGTTTADGDGEGAADDGAAEDGAADGAADDGWDQAGTAGGRPVPQPASMAAASVTAGTARRSGRGTVMARSIPKSGRGLATGVPETLMIMPEVSVVVATRNRAEALRHTLDRLRRLPERPEVIVVDNASTDGTPDLVRRDFPEVRVLRLPRNAR